MQKFIVALTVAAITAVASVAPATAAARDGKAAEAFRIAQPMRCVAVAKRRFGLGMRIPGTRAERFGPEACQRARRACGRDLRALKRRGRNPNAACVVVRRGRG